MGLGVLILREIFITFNGRDREEERASIVKKKKKVPRIWNINKLEEITNFHQKMQFPINQRIYLYFSKVFHELLL